MLGMVLVILRVIVMGIEMVNMVVTLIVQTRVEREREREYSNGHISSRNHGSILIPYNNFRSFHFLFHNRNITPINRILNIYIYIYIYTPHTTLSSFCWLIEPQSS